MSVLETLISLFSDNDIADLEKDSNKILKAFRKNGMDELLDDTEYTEHYDMVRTLKADVEQARESDDHSVQMHEGLSVVHELWKKGAEEKINVFSKLLRNTLYKNWTEDERKSFDEKYEMVVNWSDIFLSYTNRGAAMTNGKFANLIWQVYHRKLKTQEAQQQNFVARIVLEFFETENLTAFRDSEKIRCGDDIQEEIREHCRTAYAFVQLVEPKSFEKPPQGKKNWCLEEFEEFLGQGPALQAMCDNVDERRTCFLVTKPVERLKPARWPNPKYESWYGEVNRLKHEFFDGKDMDELTQAINKIAEDIDQTRSRIVDRLLRI